MKTNTMQTARKTVSFFLAIGILLPAISIMPQRAHAIGINLIKNPSAETGTAKPVSWSKGQWGTNTATFTYPAPGIDGAKAMRIDMTSYTSGDAKWFFANVPVKPSTKYVFSNSYQSNVATEADIRYKLTTGKTKIVLLGTYPASEQATTSKQFVFTTPADASALTIFHVIAKQGYLVTDNYSLTEFETAPPADTIPPTISILSPADGDSVPSTFTASADSTDNVGVSGVQFILDGANFGQEIISQPYSLSINTTTGAHTLSARARDTAGNAATSSAVSFTVTGSGGGGGDTTPPSVTITGPATGNILSGESFVSISATDNTEIAGVSLFLDDALFETEDTVSPYSFTWNTANQTDGTHTLFALARDTSGNTATSSTVTVTVSNPVIDTIPPSVHLILPLPGSAVASTTPISFGATDNVGVAGVTLMIDGILVGAEDFIAPYDFLWDTTLYTNDTHTVSAQARDAAGNIATSTAAEMTVNNIVLPPNLVLNPALETVGQNGDPENWLRGSWGINSTNFVYPSIGLDGNKAAKIEMTNYESGDAKWFFSDTPVTAGETYAFTHSYKATVATEVTARFQTPSGFFYQFVDSLPISPDWKTETFNIVVPAGATALTIFHSISANGTLEVDTYSLTLGAAPFPPEKQFLKGLISFTFDDGWITQHTQALPILNAAHFLGTFYIISQETLHADQTERIENPSMETIGANGDPENWFRGNWGSSTVSFMYPTPGASGGNAAKITVSDYADGDAKWFFGDTVVLPNEEYDLSNSYQSDTESTITLRYTYLDGTIQYVDIATLPSTGGTWQNFTKKITIPANVDRMTVFHLLRGNGSLSVDNYSLIMVPIYMNTAQMLDLQASGHEIGGHTQTHVSLSTVDPSIANAEIAGSLTDLLAMGAVGVQNMAYPYGDYNAAVETMAKNAGYVSARSVDRGFNDKSTDKYKLKIQQMDRTTTMSDVQHWVAEAAATKTWLILMFHQEDENIDHDLGVTPQFLQQIVDYVQTANLDVVTVKQGVAQMNP